MRASGMVVLAAALLLACPAAGQPADAWVLVVVGVGGDDAHRTKFTELGVRMVQAATERLAVPRDRVRLLVEREELAPELATGRSTRERVEGTVAEIGAAAAPGDRVLFLLIGHGSSRGEESFFNLPGPDLSASDFDALLSLLAEQRVALVNTASASGGFIPALAGAGRTIVTATRSAREMQEPVFVEYFVDAFAGDGADTDKDGRVSLLEAFVYADAEVARRYESEGLIRTEHARLDDDGDGEGTAEFGEDAADGAQARSFALGLPVAGVEPGEELDPAVRALLARRAELEVQLEALRDARDTMSADDYEDRLEDLLVRIAEIDRRLRGGGDR